MGFLFFSLFSVLVLIGKAVTFLNALVVFKVLLFCVAFGLRAIKTFWMDVLVT